MNIIEQFERNIGAINLSEQEILSKKKVLIAGCGGLGGYAAEYLTRIGVGHIGLLDADIFSLSNLNRQLLSLMGNIGYCKAEEAKKRLLDIRSDISVNIYNVYLNEENSPDILRNYDVIIDAFDNFKSRLILEKTAAVLGIPLVFGAVQEWSAQVSVIYPGDFLLSRLCPEKEDNASPSVLSFTPALCAAIEAAEAVKILLDKDDILRKKLLIADLKYASFDIIDLSDNN